MSEHPMDTPLPCDVKVGHITFRKGVALGIFVEAARRWHREAFPVGYTLSDEQKAANLAWLQGCPPAFDAHPGRPGAVQVCSEHDAACAEVPVGLRCPGSPEGKRHV